MTAGQRAILPLLTGRLDPEEAADLQPLTRADVERPGRAWSWSSWECDACGELLACRADRWGALYDGDPLVCLTCGAVARVSADAESPAYPSDAWGHLTEEAHADLYAEMYRDDADVIAALRGGVDVGHNPCRCGHTGADPHPCHARAYTCRQPATRRFYRPRWVGLAGAQTKMEVCETWACDACWAEYSQTVTEGPT